MSQNTFISYARDDDEPFVKRLYKDLTRATFGVWWDRVSLPSRRLTFYQEIADAIRSHDRLILVVGPKAAVSESVRQEWQWALALDKPIIPILRKGDYTHLPGELSAIQCDDFRDDAQYPAQLGRLIENLRQPEPPLGVLFGVPSLPPHFLARPDLLRQVKDALLADLKTPLVISGSDARVGVHGMGGIGKSVLAAAIARDREVRRSYPDGIIWLTVGQQPDLIRLQHDVARHLGSKEHFDTESQGQGVLRQLLDQQAVVLVLDDVWEARDTQAFDALGPRCRALVTTRDAGVLHTLGEPSVPVSLLTEEQALRLLADAVGVEPSALPSEALEVVKECGHLPLAVVLCGGMVKKRVGNWGAILERLCNAEIEKIADRQAIDERHRSIWRTMQVSVDVLSPNEKPRFAELAVFVMDNPVSEAAVATLWSHTGNLSDLDTTDLLINLAERSLIRLHQKPAESGEPVERRISLHDLLYDFATKLAGDPKALHQTILDAYGTQCTHSWPSGPNDGYFFEHLPWHLFQAGRSDELRQLLLDFNWLRGKLDATDANGLISDYDRFPDDGDLKLVQKAVRLSADALSTHKFRLAGQLIGRLASIKSSSIERLLSNARPELGRKWLRPLQACLLRPGGPLVRTITTGARVYGLLLAPDGKYAFAIQRIMAQWATKKDRRVVLWDLESAQKLKTLAGGHVGTIALNPDGRRLLVGCGSVLQEWDLESETKLRSFSGHSKRIRAVRVSEDGKIAVTGAADHTLKVWDLESGDEIRSIPCGTVTTLVLPPGKGLVASASEQRESVKLFDMDTGCELRRLEGHSGGVQLIALDRDGKRIIVATRYVLRVWDMDTGRMLQQVTSGVRSIYVSDVSPDLRWSIQGANAHRASHSEMREEVLTQEDPHLRPFAGALSSNENRAVTISGSVLKIWDLTLSDASPPLPADSASVIAVGIDSNSGTATTVSKDKTAKTWDIGTGRLLDTFDIGRVPLRRKAMVLAAEAGVVVSSAYGTLRVQNLRLGPDDRRISTLPSRVDALAVTPDGRRAVSVSWDRMIRTWDLEERRMLCAREAKWRRTKVDRWHAVAISRDGRVAVTTSRTLQTGFNPVYGARAWDVETLLVRQRCYGLGAPVTALSLTADGARAVLATENGRLVLWNTGEDRTERQLRTGLRTVTGIDLTPDGSIAVTASASRNIAVWDLDAGRIVAGFKGDHAYTCCAITGDSRNVAAGDKAGMVHFLRIEST